MRFVLVMLAAWVFGTAFAFLGIWAWYGMEGCPR